LADSQRDLLVAVVAPLKHPPTYWFAFGATIRRMRARQAGGVDGLHLDGGALVQLGHVERVAASH